MKFVLQYVADVDLATSLLRTYAQIAYFRKMSRDRRTERQIYPEDKTNAHLLHIYSRIPTHKLFTGAALTPSQ
jgi:hypothetical protein